MEPFRILDHKRQHFWIALLVDPRFKDGSILIELQEVRPNVCSSLELILSSDSEGFLMGIDKDNEEKRL